MSSQPNAQTAQFKAVDATLQRMAHHKGVLGLLVVSPKDGNVWKTCLPPSSPFDEKKLGIHAEKLHAFVSLTRSIVRTLDVHNELLFLRLRSKKHEFIISPEKEFVVIVIQDYRVQNEELQPRKQESDKKATEASAKVDGGKLPEQGDPGTVEQT
eukprot:TRINITY_DN846_c0_g1_i2.p1 TRINITY_DN846_c0_g1~~TRINITY_DN846_c0_g1_i2.p1  ORF type:complete len:155 (+),score=30.48 TRINITY_DN846_c0_g1_i2:53-517(+)